MKKTLFVLVALVGAALAMCSCSSDDTKAEKQYAVVAILKNSNVDYWRQIAATITSECKQKGLVPILTYNNENADVDGQLQNVAELSRLASEYNIKGIILSPVFTDDDHRVEQAVADFAGTDIPVVIVDTPLDPQTSPLATTYRAYVGTDNRLAGEQLATILGRDKAGTTLIAKVESSVPSKERYQGFCEYMQQQIPTWETEDVDDPANLRLALAQHPGVENLVVFNGSLCNSIITGTEGLNVYTFDVYESFLRQLLTPASTTIRGVVAQNTFEMGRRSVQALLAPVQDKNIFIPTLYITSDNIGSADVLPFMEYYNIK